VVGDHADSNRYVGVSKAARTDDGGNVDEVAPLRVRAAAVDSGDDLSTTSPLKSSRNPEMTISGERGRRVSSAHRTGKLAQQPPGVSGESMTLQHSMIRYGSARSLKRSKSLATWFRHFAWSALTNFTI
jgi:hypothetical protein